MATAETAGLPTTSQTGTETEDPTVGCSLEEELEDPISRHHPEHIPHLDNRNHDFKTQVESLSHLNPAIIEDNLDEEVGSPLTTTSPSGTSFTPFTHTTSELPSEDFSPTTGGNIAETGKRRPLSSLRNSQTETPLPGITPRRKSYSHAKPRPILTSRHRDMNDSPRINNLLDESDKPTTAANVPTTLDPFIKFTRRGNKLHPTFNPQRDGHPVTTLSTYAPSEGPLRSTIPPLIRNSSPRNYPGNRNHDLVGSRPEALTAQQSRTPPDGDDFIDLKTYADNLRKSISDLIPSSGETTDRDLDTQSLARSNLQLPTRKPSHQGLTLGPRPTLHSTPRAPIPYSSRSDEIQRSDHPSGTKLKAASHMRDPNRDTNDWESFVASENPQSQPARSSDKDFVDLQNYMDRLERIPEFLLEDAEDAVKELSDIGRQNSNDNRARQKVTIKDDGLLIDDDGIVPFTHDTDLTGLDVIDFDNPEIPDTLLSNGKGTFGNRNSDTGDRDWSIDDFKSPTFPTKFEGLEDITEKQPVSNLRKTIQQLAARRNDRKHKFRIPQRSNDDEIEETTDKTLGRRPFLSSRKGHHMKHDVSSEEEKSLSDYQPLDTTDEVTEDALRPSSRRENQLMDDFNPTEDQTLGQTMKTFTTDNPVITVHVHQIPVEVITGEIPEFTTENQRASDDTLVGATLDDEKESEVLTNFGKVIPASERTEIDTTVPDNNIFFIGNGIKLPLKMNKNDDGSLQLSVDTDKLCSCKNETCSKTHPFSESEEQNLLHTQEQQLLRMFESNEQETGDERVVNRPKRTLQAKELNEQIQVNANNREQGKVQHSSDEKFDVLSHIKGVHKFTKGTARNNKINKSNEAADHSENKKMTEKLRIEESKEQDGNEIKNQIVLVRDILKWMKNLAASYTSV